MDLTSSDQTETERIMGDRTSKAAIVALTPRGARLARALRVHLGNADLFFPHRLRNDETNDAIYFHYPVSSLMPRLFSEYGRLVFICALGLVVRLISPWIREKSVDPAVVVVDERGWNAISLLSGHAAGANQLVLDIAELIGANPVITTASDLNGIPALDEICRRKGWKMVNPHLWAPIAAALLEGEKVFVCCDGYPLQDELEGIFPGFLFISLEDLGSLPEDSWKVIITDRQAPESLSPEKTLLIRPRRLVAGLGFHRGTSPDTLQECLEKALEREGLSIQGIGALATIDTRTKEKGIRELSKRLGAELRAYTASELSSIVTPSSTSEMVRKWTGTPGVCEQAALAAAGGGRLLVRKTRFREVTVAVAEKRPPQPWGGKLFLVGIGPGDPDLIPPRARRALFTSDVVIGYSGYLNRIAHLLGPLETISSGMRQEEARLEEALSLARSGKRVSLVSGGDPGVYGMAAALGDLILSRRFEPGEVEVEVIPGIPAHCAASSLLGSPLACDFAVISLSDHLVDRERILSRIEACALADLVIVLYNPASSLRRKILAEAAERILLHRSPDVPVALVKNAWRKGETVTFISLGELKGADADMNTLVVVGNSETRVVDGWMATRRGYGKRRFR